MRRIIGTLILGLATLVGLSLLLLGSSLGLPPAAGGVLAVMGLVVPLLAGYLAPDRPGRQQA